MPAKRSRSTKPAPGFANRLDALIAFGAVALCALIVSALAWTRPATTAAGIDYLQVGHVSYSAPTSAASVYGGSNVTTGQPVYTNAVNDLVVTYAYRFGSSVPSKIDGTEQLVATINNGQGVVRSFALQSPQTFSGNKFSTSGTLALTDLQSASSAFEQMATVDGAAAYVVSITPNVAVHGRLGGAALRVGFDHSVQFNYRPASITRVGVLSLIPAGGPSAATSSNGSGGSSEPITASSHGAVPRPGGAPARLFGLSVRNARIVGPAIFAGSLLALFLLGRGPIGDLITADERRRISARHGAAVVEVDALPSAPLSTVVVSSFEGLLKVARRLVCPILHEDGERSVYAVVDGATLYRYVVNEGAHRPSFAAELARHEANGNRVHQLS